MCAELIFGSLKVYYNFNIVCMRVCEYVYVYICELFQPKVSMNCSQLVLISKRLPCRVRTFLWEIDFGTQE